MKRIEKIRAKLEVKSWDDVFLRNKPLPEDNRVVMDNPYEKSDLVYICISTTAKAIGQVPLILGKLNADGEWEEVEEEDKWKQILKKPNYLLDSYSFVEAMVSYLLLDGECWVIPFPLEVIMPDSLWVVPQKTIDPIKNENTGQLDGWLYKPSESHSLPLSIMEVSHLFFWNPYNPIKGFAPLRAGKIPVLTDYKAAKYNQVFFDNFASLGGVLSTDLNLNDKQHDRLKAEIANKHKGYEHAHDMLILYGGLKYHATTPTHREMSFKDLRSLDKEKILQVFGMKKAIISVTDDLNYATSMEQRKSWWQDTNMPIMKLICSALNFTFFENYNLELRFDTSSIEALQEDFGKKVETAGKLAELGYSANEINEKLDLGFENVPLRDVVWRPATQIPYNLKERPDNTLDEPLDEGLLIEETEEEVFIPNKVKSTLIEYKRYDFNKVGEKIWKAVVNLGGNIERTFRSKVNKAFMGYRNNTLYWLYSQQKSVKSDVPFILTRPIIELNDLSIKPFNILKGEADALYESALLYGIETLATEVPEIIPVDLLVQPEAQQFLKEKVINLVGEDGIQRTISKKLNIELINGMDARESIDEIAGRIKNVFGVARNRVKTIARTEVFGSLNRGRYLMGEASPFGVFTWFTAMDEKVRIVPYNHAAMYGVTRRKGELWIVGGDSLLHPGDWNGAAGNVINCRCIEIPDMNSIIYPT
jgi:HK97 family phage portal protein